VNLLSEGQYARVLQLPVVRREQDVSGEAEKADAAADLRVPAEPAQNMANTGSGAGKSMPAFGAVGV
jgi:hypothetical protein